MSEQQRSTPKIGVEHPRCPFCHEEVRPGDDEEKQSCGACMAWHHAECWQEHGGCSACQQRDSAATLPTYTQEAEKSPGKGKLAEPAPAKPRQLQLVVTLLCLGLVFGGGVLAYVLFAPRPAPPREALVDSERPAGPAAWKQALLDAANEEQRAAAVRLGAEAGDPGAMNQLGFRLLTGLGCERNEEEAARWGMLAAEAGHAEAMYGLGMLYEQGRGVPRSEAKAVHWYRKAVAAGDTMAGPQLDTLLRRRPDLR